SVGAWVLIKLTPVLALSPVGQQVAITLGALTAIGAALISAAQVDIKRVLSYLSSSYLGLVFIAVGAQQVGAAYFLLLTLGVAMATIVASTGSVILTCVTQDLTQLGGLWSRRPVTGFSYLIGASALVGLPPLGSFWSIRTLLDGLWYAGDFRLVVVLLVTNAITAFSLMRMFGLMFLGPPQVMTARAPEPIWSVMLPMMALAAMALHAPIILHSMALLPIGAVGTMGILLLFSSLLGGVLGALLYGMRVKENPEKILPSWLVELFAYDFYTPKIYQNTVILGVATLATVSDWLDRYVVDGAVNLIGLVSVASGESLKYNNTGRLQFYVLTIAAFVVILGVFMSLATLVA
ncbi:MAG: proton-conducting transporter membrane subunit, partial [Cyanobacteria bacterium J06560_2]